jgi:hypothetical protein
LLIPLFVILEEYFYILSTTKYTIVGGGIPMAVKKKKSSIIIGLLFLMTTLVGMQTSAAALETSLLAEAGGPYVGEECSSMLLNASGSYNPENNPLTYRWNIDGLGIENGNYPYMEWTWYDDFSGIITLEVSDGTNTATDTANVIISNVPPQILSTEGPTEVDAEAEFSLSVNFFDGMPDPRSPTPSFDTFMATFFWDDGSSTELFLGAEEFSVSASHLYTENGIYQIMITIVDDEGGEAVAEWDVMVGNIALIEAGPGGIVDEGSLFLSAGFLADADSPSYTAIVDYYDETGPQTLPLNEGNTFVLSHLYADDGMYTILVTVFNEDVEYGSDTADVMVKNVPPNIESLSVSPSNPYRPGDSLELTATFSDPGILDTHIMTIEWGDGTSTNISIDAGITMASSSHSYQTVGDYEIAVTLADDDGGVCNTSMQVVVKNPTTSTDALKGIIVGLKIPKGLRDNLLSMLENLPHLLKHHRVQAAVHQLRAFIHYVEAQSSKKLPRNQARELVNAARLIIDSLKIR